MSMAVLKAKGIEPIVVAITGFKHCEGIYEEVNESNVPKKNRMDELGEAFVTNEDYIRSNTAGITLGKYFKKIANLPDFEPKKADKFEILKDKILRYDTNTVLRVLEETDDDSNYLIGFSINDIGLFNIEVARYLKDDEVTIVGDEFKEFEENFIGLYDFEISFKLAQVKRHDVKEIKRLCDEKMHVKLETLKEIISAYDLEIAIEKYFYGVYNKERSHNFRVKQLKGISAYDYSLSKIMTFAEASEIWGMDGSTLRKLVKTDKVKEGIDYRKSGKVWLITEDAMNRIYGPKK